MSHGCTQGKPTPNPRVMGPLAPVPSAYLAGQVMVSHFLHMGTLSGTHLLVLGLATVTYEHRWVPMSIGAI